VRKKQNTIADEEQQEDDDDDENGEDQEDEDVEIEEPPTKKAKYANPVESFVASIVDDIIETCLPRTRKRIDYTMMDY